MSKTKFIPQTFTFSRSREPKPEQTVIPELVTQKWKAEALINLHVKYSFLL